MGAPKKLSSYRLFYWNIAQAALEQRGQGELRFPVGDGRKAEPLKAMVTGFRAALEASDKFGHQELGAALRLYSVQAEEGEIVLRLKGAGAMDLQIDHMRRVQLLDLKNGGLPVREVAQYRESDVLKRFLEASPQASEADEALERMGFSNLAYPKRGE